MILFSFSKVYVQDILQNKLEAKVCNLLHKEDGHLYVCGDVRMARDVAQTLKGILVKNLNLTEQQAEEYFFELKVCCGVQGILSIQTVLSCGLEKTSELHSRSNRLQRASFQQHAKENSLSNQFSLTTIN